MFFDHLLEFSSSVYVFLFILSSVFCIYFGWKLNIFWKNLMFRINRKIGRHGELNAQKLLKEDGYTIINSQFTIPICLYVDNEPVNFYIRPDYLVERDGKRYLAEVKTGESSSPTNTATRRQLCEYSRLSISDGVILVDASDEKIMHVRFNYNV